MSMVHRYAAAMESLRLVKVERDKMAELSYRLAGDNSQLTDEVERLRGMLEDDIVNCRTCNAEVVVSVNCHDCAGVDEPDE